MLDYTDQPDLTLSLHMTNINAVCIAKCRFVQLAGFIERFAKITKSAFFSHAITPEFCYFCIGGVSYGFSTCFRF